MNGVCIDALVLEDPEKGYVSLPHCGNSLPSSKFETSKNTLNVYYRTRNIAENEDFKLLISIKKKEGQL